MRWMVILFLFVAGVAHATPPTQMSIEDAKDLYVWTSRINSLDETIRLIVELRNTLAELRKRLFVKYEIEFDAEGRTSASIDGAGKITRSKTGR